MTKVVRPRIAASIACWTWRSVLASSALFASSGIIIGGWMSSACAIDSAAARLPRRHKILGREACRDPN